jgi:hypothetical protein
VNTVAVATACSECAAGTISRAEQYEPGRYMGIVHAEHIGEMQREGWVVDWSLYSDGTPDLVCRHLAPELR